MEADRNFSLDELGKFDGKEGRPSYVGYKGKVYDVTESSLWIGGDHLGHEAGEDLTEQMEIAPHGEDVIKRMKVVGVLARP